MQKQVSKQSLAVLALSILLAISMALTATFAGFTASESATGTITFTESNVQITFSGWEGGALTLGNTDFEVADATAGTVKLNADAIDKIEALKVSVSGAEAGFELQVTATMTATADAVTIVVATFENAASITDQAVFATVTANPVAAASASGTFTVKVDATLVTAA